MKRSILIGLWLLAGCGKESAPAPEIYFGTYTIVGKQVYTFSDPTIQPVSTPISFTGQISQGLKAGEIAFSDKYGFTSAVLSGSSFTIPPYRSSIDTSFVTSGQGSFSGKTFRYHTTGQTPDRQIVVETDMAGTRTN